MKLLSTVFHEVRNPLGLINLHAELIKKNPENALVSAEIISRASRDLEKTLTELLEISKPLTVEKAQGDLARNVNDLINMFRPSFEKENVNIVFENNLEHGEKAGYDRVKLNQALINLIKNALEFSKPGDEIKISLKKQNNSYIIKISDQGEGIPPENREKIFDPYFTTREKGTGIGLAQARKIIEAHGGTLSIDPEKTEGTTFIVRLKGSENGHTE